ncbi:hypothetical protein [Streptomyces sp. NBC_00038]|nr:hypothetical protein [Streptomyces sp. NBC_00038]MCX5562741.1 hypothetical protein [Streptomyces sp. NBC_00038]MCX5563609.1 hypothetical protein [Streptomyces sp. NBC_00038]
MTTPKRASRVRINLTGAPQQPAQPPPDEPVGKPASRVRINLTGKRTTE